MKVWILVCCFKCTFQPFPSVHALHMCRLIFIGENVQFLFRSLPLCVCIWVFGFFHRILLITRQYIVWYICIQSSCLMITGYVHCTWWNFLISFVHIYIYIVLDGWFCVELNDNQFFYDDSFIVSHCEILYCFFSIFYSLLF